MDNFSLNYYKNQKKLGNSFEKSLNYVEFQLLTAFFLGSLILHKSGTAFTDMHSFGLIWPKM